MLTTLVEDWAWLGIIAAILTISGAAWRARAWLRRKLALGKDPSRLVVHTVRPTISREEAVEYLERELAEKGICLSDKLLTEYTKNPKKKKKRLQESQILVHEYRLWVAEAVYNLATQPGFSGVSVLKPKRGLRHRLWRKVKMIARR